MEKKYTQEIIALRDRVKVGNNKLNTAWRQLRDTTNRQEVWNEQMERWHQAKEKLSLLCTQLQTMGYEDCLYMENGKKMKKCLEPGDSLSCLICPSKIPYWEKEFTEL